LVFAAGAANAQETWTARAELKFPELSGRVVDDAQLIEPAVRAFLTQELQAHEQATREQLVVVTVPNLQGARIEGADLAEAELET